MSGVFESDLQQARPYTFEMWQHRSWRERISELMVLPFKSQLQAKRASRADASLCFGAAEFRDQNRRRK